MKISIVVPNLNEARYLPMFLKSLEQQTYRDFEVIIVDGGSKDGSLEIIGSFIFSNFFKGKTISTVIIVNRTRNIGYIRNVGAKHASGDILFHTSSDTYLEPRLLEKIAAIYSFHSDLVSLAGRTYPLGTSIIAHIGYQLFDFLRFTFTCLPPPFRKYRPSGNFTCVRNSAFQKVNGYPNVPVNEDGLLGQRLDGYAYANRKAVMFSLNLWIGHHVKKFEKIGGLQAIMFYFYTLSNLFPMIKPLLAPIEVKASLVFSGQANLKKLSLKDCMIWLWNWL